MPLESVLANDPHNLNEPFAFLYAAERFYAGFTTHAVIADAIKGGCAPNLGGQLLYAGELNEATRALVAAANIAGAATLCATADAAAQRMANRDGIVDFVVTSLDEALRILKNEIRKQETVAVCVGVAPDALEAEMLERGVRPDLSSAESSWSDTHVRSVEPVDAGSDETLLLWHVAETPARWMPRLDAMAMEMLEPEDECARRWLRLHPRYCGRIARGIHLLRCGPEVARNFIARVEVESLRAEIGVAVDVRMNYRGLADLYRFTPGTAASE